MRHDICEESPGHLWKGQIILSVPEVIAAVLEAESVLWRAASRGLRVLGATEFFL